ncbi:MAG: hypothetical protein FWF90_16845 [Promicromonosporaceae bacterium]|nr:hypothetical protein [Promicromonosporaceae bacterium]
MNLPFPVAIGIWIVIGLLLLVVIVLGLLRLTRRGGDVVPAPPAPPADLGALRLGPLDATYVSTTLAGDWLARVGAHRLGERSAATVTVHDSGVLVERSGAPALFLPAAALRGAALAPGMAGKYVGADGLVVVTWQAPSDGAVDAADLDTGVRTRHPADRSRLVDAVRDLAAHPLKENP